MRIAQPGKKFWAFENVVGQIPPPLSGLHYGKLIFFFYYYFFQKVFKAILAKKNHKMQLIINNYR